MDIGTYTEQIKNKTLYESHSEDSIVSDMLSEWPTNKRYTSSMAKRLISMKYLINTFPGKYKYMFDDVLPEISTMFRSVDGWSVMQALAAEGKKAAAEAVEQKKGLFDKKQS